MASQSVLITGANRGIGLGLVKQLLKKDKFQYVFAGTRNVDKSKELYCLQELDNRLHIIELDVDNDESIHKAFNIMSATLGENGLNVLINNAGICMDYEFKGEIQRELFNKNYNTNVTSVTVLSQIFYPLLQMASKKNRNDEMGINRAAIINISSIMGSIDNNTTGSLPLPKELLEKLKAQDGNVPLKPLAYRSSKAALNMLTKSISLDLLEEGILVVGICPGWVQTDMGSSSAFITVEESTSAIVSTLYSLNKEHTGRLVDRNGEYIAY